jgi:hypothetical protein
MKLFLRKHIPKMELRGGGKPNFGEIKQKLNKGQKKKHGKCKYDSEIL